MFEKIVDSVHKWLPDVWALVSKSKVTGAAIIMAAALFLAKLVDLFTQRVLFSLVRRSKIRLDDAILKAVHRPTWLTIVLLGALASVRWLGPRPPFEFILVGLLKSIMVLMWALAVNRVFHRISVDWVHHWQQAGRQGIEIIRLGENLAKVLVLAGAAFWLLSIWQINVTPLLASAGIAGVAVALAAKETLANFFGGVSVFLDQPFRMGDYIILDSGERGEVVEIGLRSTRILTRDDVQISIPNSIIANTKVVNESAPQPRFRVRLKVGVAYGSDVEEVEEVLLGVARQNSLLVRHPEPRVRFRTFGDSSLDFELLCWVEDPREKGKVMHQLNCEIYKALNKAGIEIPYPQRDVHLYTHGRWRQKEAKAELAVARQDSD
ncbi:MAG: mechanosensitive ion channel family protein [Deltaproteobacteria bacterium]|nr:mechanosensitive ion channel family protein [Deltaproteobacteria bacterium]MBW2071293.1 mechanosensitive ion channel family protein [Deltaproteobacteria bacterium]